MCREIFHRYNCTCAYTQGIIQQCAMSKERAEELTAKQQARGFSLSAALNNKVSFCIWYRRQVVYTPTDQLPCKNCIDTWVQDEFAPGFYKEMYRRNAWLPGDRDEGGGLIDHKHYTY